MKNSGDREQSEDEGSAEMKLDEIREIARQRGLKPGKMKKGELIRAIQEAEGNPVCFATGSAAVCGQAECLWREDCDRPARPAQPGR